MFKNKRISDIVKELILLKRKEYNLSIDLTMGNGHDTLFLSQISKKVYSFDIQKIAIENSKKLLTNANNIDFILDSHENIEKYLSEKLDCAMMNLGYLPGSDKEIRTKEDSTLTAVKKTLSLMNENSIFAIVAYIAHKGGLEEYQSLINFLAELNKDFAVTKIEYINRDKASPKIIIIEK